MLGTDFSPRLNGSTDWAFTQPENLSDWRLKKEYKQARARLLGELRHPYFNAVETYNLPRNTGRWIENALVKVLARQAGQIYTTLDYYSALLPLPRRMSALGARKEAVFYWYFCERALANLEANAGGLLEALAISGLIPDAWFPEKDLETLIEKEIQRAGRFRGVEVDCQLGLAPGGLRWLDGVTRQAVAEIRDRLAAGQPWPVRLVRSPSRLEGNRQVIVYAGEDLPRECLRLEIFEPGYLWKKHALLVKTADDWLEVVEIAPRSRPLPVLGLLCEGYSPAPPPRECIPWWLRSEVVRRLWWKIRRRWGK